VGRRFLDGRFEKNIDAVAGLGQAESLERLFGDYFFELKGQELGFCPLVAGQPLLDRDLFEGGCGEVRFEEGLRLLLIPGIEGLNVGLEAVGARLIRGFGFLGDPAQGRQENRDAGKSRKRHDSGRRAHVSSSGSKNIHPYAEKYNMRGMENVAGFRLAGSRRRANSAPGRS
jgi:hypothetical protein